MEKMTMKEREELKLFNKNNTWIYRTLKDKGNCYVNKLVDLKLLEETTGLKLKIRVADCEGYIIEVIKNDIKS